MKRRKAVWASSLWWRAPSQVSAHHYARLLVQQGWDVAFLSHPISPWHFLRAGSRGAAVERWHSWRHGGESDLDGHLLHYTPLTLVPPHESRLLRGEAVLRHWPRFTLPNLDRFLRRHGFGEVDLLVLDSPLHGGLLDRLPSRKTVLRIVDHLGGFPGVPPSWVERERQLVGAVDHVVVTARVLEQTIAAQGPRALTHVPNGVQIDHFLRAEAALPDEYRTIPAPRAVYVGAVEAWFDVALLAQVAAALPAVSFVLIGDGKSDLSPLRQLRNVHLLGRRPYGCIPAYLKHAQVGLIPFQRNALTRAVNPIKLYEYMACGLPVVATAWEELSYLASPATLCDTAAEFAEAIRATLLQPPDPEQLLSFARQADWQARARLLFEAVGVA